MKAIGRVDDLYSLLYMTAELKKPLPWTYLEGNELILKKKNAKLTELFDNDEFLKVQTMIESFSYRDFPNYGLLFETFLEVFLKSGSTWMSPYDWEGENMPSFQEWVKEANKPRHLFQWEVPEVVNYLRTDFYTTLKKDVPRAEKRNKKKAHSNTQK